MKRHAHQKLLSAAAAASVLLMTAACGSSESDAGAAPAETTTSAAPSDEATTEGGDDSASGTYADGDYSGEGSYSNPGGESSVKVDLTIADGSVTAVEVTPEATNGTSKQYQTQFAGGIADEVVGKSLDDIDVSKVAGSSLTSGGFNQAIEAIKAEAQA